MYESCLEISYPFREIEAGKYFDKRRKDIENEIAKETEEYILNVDEEEYIEALRQRYSYEPISILLETCKVYAQPRKLSDREVLNRHWGGTVYQIPLVLNYTGSKYLLRLCPSTSSFVIGSIQDHSIKVYDGYLICYVYLWSDEFIPAKFENEKNNLLSGLFIQSNIKSINLEVEYWNRQLVPFIKSVFNRIKQKYIDKNSFFKAIGVPMNDEPVIVTVKQQKRIQPYPQMPENRQYTHTPTLANESYKAIIRILKGAGQQAEKLPSLYIGKKEEELRDYFLSQLDNRLDNAVASGETYNCLGKTDICIKHTDGSCLFIAECKFWKGAKAFSDAIYQLFDNYLTWRETKAVLMIFVKEGNITDIETKIKEAVKFHPYYKRSNLSNGTMSYIFHTKSDVNCEVYFDILVFHFPHSQLKQVKK